MNATERLVERYFQLCHHCFTLTDIKVENGNNRQFDLLAYQPSSKQYVHVEISVTHDLGWTATLDQLAFSIEKKFFGAPSPRPGGGPRTDAARGKSYQSQIAAMYTRYGAAWPDVQRVWCLWHYASDAEALIDWQGQLSALHPEIHPNRFKVLSFRDEVLPRLSQVVGSHHHEDDLLRVLSLQQIRLNQVSPTSTATPATANPFSFSI
jgi:hypothetical protein